MPRAKHKRKPKDNRDFAEVAFDVFQRAIGDSSATRRQTGKVKNPAAVELGSKGGKARAAALSKRQRADIARAAASEKWRRYYAERGGSRESKK